MFSHNCNIHTERKTRDCLSHTLRNTPSEGIWRCICEGYTHICISVQTRNAFWSESPCCLHSQHFRLHCGAVLEA